MLAAVLLLGTIAVNRCLASPREVRAVWLTTIGGLDWPQGYAQSPASAAKQQKQLCHILDRLEAGGINTVLLQTRVRATTIYPSIYEPWDGCLSGFPGTSPGYDALQFAIDECHKRGMELHAWVVCIPVGKWASYGCKRLRGRQPKLIKRIGDEGFMNPEQSATALYLADFCGEIASRYDVDGIHLDYIRYPETWGRIANKDAARDNITRIVRAINISVKAAKPWIKLSCSPIGKYRDLPRHTSRGWNAYDRVCQDAQLWLRTGLMDQLYPMLYFDGDNHYPFIADWTQNSYGGTIVSGLGAYLLAGDQRDWPLATIVRQMYVARQLGAGHAYFRSRFFTDDTKGLYTFARGQFDRYPALSPAIADYGNLPPEAPKLHCRRTAEGDALWWSAVRGTESYTLYNIYASTTWPVDTSDPAALVAPRRRATAYLVARSHSAKPMYYAVAAMDRYGRESPAAQLPSPHAATAYKPRFANPVLHLRPATTKKAEKQRK